ncbi:MAG TPA: hypothetical protein VGD01_03015 [Candidatus Elarobacter sp.]|jgi:hypothetical protein
MIAFARTIVWIPAACCALALAASGPGTASPNSPAYERQTVAIRGQEEAAEGPLGRAFALPGGRVGFVTPRSVYRLRADRSHERIARFPDRCSVSAISPRGEVYCAGQRFAAHLAAGTFRTLAASLRLSLGARPSVAAASDTELAFTDGLSRRVFVVSSTAARTYTVTPAFEALRSLAVLERNVIAAADETCGVVLLREGGIADQRRPRCAGGSAILSRDEAGDLFIVYRGAHEIIVRRAGGTARYDAGGELAPIAVAGSDDGRTIAAIRVRLGSSDASAYTLVVMRDGRIAAEESLVFPDSVAVLPDGSIWVGIGVWHSFAVFRPKR